jgi:Tol biopolymer transport system component
MCVLRLKRRTNLLKVSLIAVAAILAACLLAWEVRVQPSQAAFPGGNGKIAFSTYRDGHVQQSAGGSWPSAEIYVMDADGSNALNITNDPLSDDSGPTYSPDGTKLAFGSYRVGSPNPVRIYIMNADGSGVRHASVASRSFHGSTWSPDSSKLAFSREWYDNGIETDIWVMNADGSGQTNITADLGFYEEVWPTWSPDGSKIAFTGLPTDEGDYGDIYVMNADGSNITSLTDDRDFPDSYPQWSPDGTKIIFQRGFSRLAHHHGPAATTTST